MRNIDPDVRVLTGFDVRVVRLGPGCYLAAPDVIVACAATDDLPPGAAICARASVDRAEARRQTVHVWLGDAWHDRPYDGEYLRRFRGTLGNGGCHRRWYQRVGAEAVTLAIEDARLPSSTALTAYVDLKLVGTETTLRLDEGGTAAVCGGHVADDAHRTVVCVEPHGAVRVRPDLLELHRREVRPLPDPIDRGALDGVADAVFAGARSAATPSTVPRCAAVDLRATGMRCRQP